MGQRHQVFLIARVRPQNGDPAYRCVAAFHHQWCYGTLPLLAMYRLLRLVSRPENGAIIRAELHEMDGKYGCTPKDRNQMPAVPCPYSVSLVATAWTSNLDTSLGSAQYDGVTLRHCVLNANMGCWDGDNNDGISIIDVTDPMDPAYCFIKHDVPMSAYEYLRSYYTLTGLTDNDPTHHYWVSVHNLSGIRLLTAEVLQETWPHESFRPRTPEQDHVLARRHLALFSDAAGGFCLSTEVQRMMDNPEDDEPEKWLATLASRPDFDPADPVYLQMKSLLLRDPRVFNFRYTPEPVSVPSDDLEHLLRLSSKPRTSGDDDDFTTAARAHVKTALRALSPFPDEYLDGLVKMTVMGEDRFADLSGYDLSAAQIARFVTQCPNLDALDISQNPHLTIHDIPDILLAAPNLRRVNVSDCSQIDGAALLELIRTQPSLFRTIEALVHPAFLTIVKPPNFPIAFTFMFAGMDGISGVALPLFTPTQVLQALCRLLPLAWRSEIERMARNAVATSTSSDEAGEDVNWFLQALFQSTVDSPGSMLMSSPMLAYSAFSGGSQRVGESWSDRPVVGVPLHPYPAVSAEPEGSWAFFLDWSNPTHGTQKWAFIRYGPNEQDDEPAAQDCTVQRAGTRRGKVYDLGGFLRCMAEEGRPSPPEEVAIELEDTLYARHQYDGTLVCPLMEEEDTPNALPLIPQVPIRDADGDFKARLMFTLASGLHSQFSAM